MRRIFSTRYSENVFSIGLFILRAGAGALMIPHGYDKLNKFGEMTTGFPDPFHVGPTASLALLIFAEFFCAIFIILGLFTRLACIPLIIAMSMAVYIGHKGQIFGEGEHAALYVIIFACLLFTGPGKFSLDKIIGK
jgi:putative oxidoreductase